MEQKVRRSLWVWAVVSAISFFAGGVYTEMIKEGLGFSLSNLLLALVGAVLTGVPFFIGAYLVQWLLGRR